MAVPTQQQHARLSLSTAALQSAAPLPRQPPTKSRATQLFEAVCSGDVPAVKRLVTPALANYSDPRCYLPLVAWAVSLHHVEILRLLLASGASVNARDRNGYTAIQRAAWDSAPIETLPVLLEYGADIDAVGTIGKKTALILAAIKGNTAMVEALLRNGADVELRDLDGMSAVDHATYLGFADIVSLLIEAGADCHAARYYCEEGVKLVETIPQRDNFDRIIALLCLPWAQQSIVSIN